MMPFFIILLAFLVDRLSKWWAASYLSEHGPTQINAFMTMRETTNRGIAFGMLQGTGPLAGWLSVAVVAGLFIYLVRQPKDEWLVKIGLGLIIGGALGNLVDRITIGRVLDFIEMPLRLGVFNAADVAINVGIIVILLATIWSTLRSRNENMVEATPSGQNE